MEGVIPATIDKMIQLGASKQNITAILGPTISHTNYEVDAAFKDRFIDRDTSWARFFSRGNRIGHAQFNLPAFIVEKLEQCNIGKVFNLDRCTYGEDDQFFSYRRSTHRNEPDYGRQISAIALI